MKFNELKRWLWDEDNKENSAMNAHCFDGVKKDDKTSGLSAWTKTTKLNLLIPRSLSSGDQKNFPKFSRDFCDSPLSLRGSPERDTSLCNSPMSATVIECGGLDDDSDCDHLDDVSTAPVSVSKETRDNVTKAKVAHVRAERDILVQVEHTW